jgi:hypothetical protein
MAPKRRDQEHNPDEDEQEEQVQQKICAFIHGFKRFPLSSRVRTLQRVLDQLDLGPKPEPYPPVKPPGEPRMAIQRERR